MVRARPVSSPPGGSSPSAGGPGGCRRAGAGLRFSRAAGGQGRSRSAPGGRPADDRLGQVADADLRAGAQVEGLAFHAGGLGGPQEAGDGVGDVGQVAAGVQVAQADHVLGQGLGDDGRDHGAGGLARAVGVEGPQGDHRQLVGAVEALGQLVGADLAGGVGRLALQGVVFVDRHA